MQRERSSRDETRCVRVVRPAISSCQGEEDARTDRVITQIAPAACRIGMFAKDNLELLVLSVHVPLRAEARHQLVPGTGDFLGDSAEAIGTCSKVMKLGG